MNKQVETKETAKLKSTIALLEGQMDQMKELLLGSDQIDAWKDMEEKFIKEYEGKAWLQYSLQLPLDIGLTH